MRFLDGHSILAAKVDSSIGAHLKRNLLEAISVGPDSRRLIESMS